jgi:hypothetical protein
MALLGALLLLWLKFFNAEPSWQNLLCLLLAALFPGQVYYHAVFPISLSVLCTLGCLHGMARERWVLAGIGGAGAACTYSMGFLLVPVLAASILLTSRGRPRERTLKLLGAAVLTGLGYVLVMVHFQLAVGAWDAFFKVQAKYSHHLQNPLWDLLYRILNAPNDGPCMQTLLTTVLIGLAAFASLRSWRQGPAPDLLEVCILLYTVVFWIFPFFVGNQSSFRVEALLMPVVFLLRRLPADVLVGLVVAAAAIDGWIARLFFRGILV